MLETSKQYAASKTHRFNRHIRALCHQNNDFYDIAEDVLRHNKQLQSGDVTISNEDKKSKTFETDQVAGWTVLASRTGQGVSCLRTSSLDAMNFAHECTLTKQGCFWFDEEKSALSPLIQSFVHTSEKNPNGDLIVQNRYTKEKRVVGRHVIFSPKVDMPLSEFLESFKKPLQDCKLIYGGESSYSCFDWPERAPVPSESIMQHVSGALYQYCKSAQDGTDSTFAYLYYHHIGAVDWTWDECMHSDWFLPRLVGKALNLYLPTCYGDYAFIDDAKHRLETLLPGYEAVYEYFVWDDFHDQDIASVASR